VYGSVLGSDSRTARNDTLRGLLAFGLAQYRGVTTIDRGRVYAEVETGYGRPAVKLMAPHAVVRAVRVGTPLVERVVAPTSVALPVRAGQRIGKVEVYDGNRLVASSNLVAASAVTQPGVLAKARWYATQTAQNLWEIVT
jgi:D-alanyl-D-alanine carboxypeptidase